MKRQLYTAAILASLGMVLYRAQGQNPVGQAAQSGQPPKSNADPYANNPDPGKMQFPLAAPAGKDSGAYRTALPGGVNQGPVDPSTWKYGHQFDAPPNSKIWNPVKLKMMRGEKVTGGTVFASSDPAVYCAMANAVMTSSGPKCSTPPETGKP